MSRLTPSNERNSAPISKSLTPSADDALIVGRLKITPQGRAFLQPDDPGLPTIVVPAGKTRTALNDDRVAVRREPAIAAHARADADSMTAHVVRVLERKRARHVGTLRRTSAGFDVMPDDPCAPRAIHLLPSADFEPTAHVGKKVVVLLDDLEPRATAIFGRVIEVLGAPAAPGVDLLCVLHQHGLPLAFPDAVERAARAFGTSVDARDHAGRIDCRAHPVITIDPADARDFDDAFCLRDDGDAGFTLWVHIADVAHYVTPGSVIDLEARTRGNSTYLVDRVIPMLPESLSNGLCSLVPHADRLTNCAEFKLANDGRVNSSRFYRAIIHSQRRFSYEDAAAAIARRPNDAIERMLHGAHAVAQQIRARRFRDGALELDVAETKIRLDVHGRVAHVTQTTHDGAHQLIEEFMLLANEAVARHLLARRLPALHRVHEAPEPARLAAFHAEVVRARVPCGDLRQRKEVQALLARLDAAPAGAALRVAFLKSLARARYATEPLGHFGLAKTEYTHFTSPIRRYADLVVHRALCGEGEAAATLTKLAAQISETERNSALAERESKVIKLLAYLADRQRAKEPPHYAATIVDVRDFGFFIDIPSLGIGGLVYSSTLTRTDARRTFALGERVSVEVESIDTSSRQVDFRLVRKASAARNAARRLVVAAGR